ncbi:hypothetical protein [Calidithermus timidus]|jgi:Na+-translocating ferredoxin:NAD+ oxidoreductase RnfD subunit|uniref:hypothetical protein n=1 Tax=Calidithermus timidus TaxID=307124 RepID=UPI00036F22AF|nr:hypothetical protein [Calidithermus timidus]
MPAPLTPSLLEALLEPQAPLPHRRRGYVLLYVVGGVAQLLLAALAFTLLEPLGAVPGWVGTVYLGIALAAWAWLLRRKQLARISKQRTRHVASALLDVASLSTSLLLAAISLRAELPLWALLIAGFALVAYTAGLAGLLRQLEQP